MKPKTFGALAACVAALGVVLGALSVALELPLPAEITMVVGALVLLAAAGGLIGAAVAAQKKSRT